MGLESAWRSYDPSTGGDCEEPAGAAVGAGLEIFKAGDALEIVTSEIGEFRLLTAGSGNEVVFGTFTAGGRLTLIPPVDVRSAPTEMYFVLEGRLRHDAGRRSWLLGPGDYIVARDLREVHIFEAVTDVRFLYVTSQPFFHEISGRIEELRKLAVEVEMKDGYTAEHCTRLQNLSYATGRTLDLGQERLHQLEYGSYLHDVGKARIPVEILTKPSSLTAEEWQVIRRHPTLGREMLAPTVLRSAGGIVEQHHERLDGSGYPLGLSGDEIAVESYIVAVADTYDAMTTDRAYRKALPRSVAFTELDKHAGVLYPREVVRAFRDAVARVE